MRLALAWVIAALSSFQSFEAAALDLVTITDAGTDRAVVFVHGFQGDWKTTFEKPSKIVRCPNADPKNAKTMSWACILKSDDEALLGKTTLVDFSVFSVDYASLKDSSIPDAAKQIGRLLEERRIFHNYNHVWLVAHSLGGLITKRMLLSLKNEGKQRYLNRIAGVLLFAVPSKGARLADAADSIFVRWSIRFFGGNTRFVEDMRSIASNSFLEAMEADWSAFLRRDEDRKVFPWRPAVHCAFERAKAGAIVLVVSLAEAQTSCLDNVAPQEFDRDHFEIVKPEDVKDPVHVWLRDSIARSYLRAKRAPFLSKEGSGSLKEYIDWLDDVTKSEIDPKTMLPVVPGIAEISSGSEKDARQLLIKDGRYVGATVADFLEHIADRNSCIVVKSRKDRRHTTVEVIASQTHSCANEKIMCAGTPC